MQRNKNIHLVAAARAKKKTPPPCPAAVQKMMFTSWSQWLSHSVVWKWRRKQQVVYHVVFFFVFRFVLFFNIKMALGSEINERGAE